jgi:hypothetical protein
MNMQKLEIKDMKYINDIPVNVNMIHQIVIDKLNKAGVTFKSSFAENIIIFEGNQIFSSKSENRIPLSSSDKRSKELKRNFLKSKRLNEEQYKQVFDALSVPFDDLKISCKIVFHSDKITEVWRDGMQTTFPSINYNLLPKKA